MTNRKPGEGKEKTLSSFGGVGRAGAHHTQLRLVSVIKTMVTAGDGCTASSSWGPVRSLLGNPLPHYPLSQEESARPETEESTQAAQAW